MMRLFILASLNYSFISTKRLLMESWTNKLLKDLMDELAPVTRHIDDLFVMGYDQPFELAGAKLMCPGSGSIFYARELTVDYLHHVPGIGYVYGIRHDGSNVKGIFVCYTVNTISFT